MMTDLYRHYSADGNLLYVGISKSAVARLAQHAQTSSWVKDIVTITVEKFSTRKEALNAERFAIASEKPIYNKQKSPTIRPATPVIKNFYIPSVTDEMPVLYTAFHPERNICDESCSPDLNLEDDEDHNYLIETQLVQCCFNNEVAAFHFFCDYCGSSRVISKLCADPDNSPVLFPADAKKYIYETDIDQVDDFFAHCKQTKRAAKIRDHIFDINDYLPWWRYNA